MQAQCKPNGSMLTEATRMRFVVILSMGEKISHELKGKKEKQPLVRFGNSY